MSRRKSKPHLKKQVKRKTPAWPILLAVGGLLLLGVAFLASRDAPAPQVPVEVVGNPSLEVDKERVDLGDVKLDQPVQVVFQLTNVGDQTLRFTQEPYIEVVEGC